jgi:TRAP-type C4-dicarboxylate transport system permease small subunit
MKSENLVKKVQRILDAVTAGVSWVGAGALILMVMVVVGNVLGRYLFRKPLLGAVELVGLLTVIVVFCVLAYAEARGSHVVVDILVSRFSGRIRVVLAGAMSIFGAVFFLIMGWQGWSLMLSNLSPFVRTTGVLSIPFAPFMGVMALGCLLFGLELTVHVFNPASRKIVHKESQAE